MKKALTALVAMTAFTLILTGCGEDETNEPVEAEATEATEDTSNAVDARAIFELDRVYLDGEEVEISETDFDGSRLTFIGEEQGGTVVIRIGETDIIAYINPSREHPSYAEGYWHHHLYAASTETGSPRISFMELLPELDIDDHEEAGEDNTQSVYQRGNLHYVVATGEYRLRLTIDGVVHELMFVEQ